jgi:hypothetical protein
MSAEIVNLRQARKKRERAQKDAQAAANRALFGERKADKALRRAEERQAAERLEGHRREPTEPR